MKRTWQPYAWYNDDAGTTVIMWIYMYMMMVGFGTYKVASSKDPIKVQVFVGLGEPLGDLFIPTIDRCSIHIQESF